MWQLLLTTPSVQGTKDRFEKIIDLLALDVEAVRGVPKGALRTHSA